MSNRIKSYLVALSDETHLLIALFLGFLFRLAASWYVFGAQALDDYRHGLLPAYQGWAEIPSTLPDYRSPLLTWVLEAGLHIAEFFSITQPVSQARFLYLCLGVFSLLGIYAAYRLTRNSENRLHAPLAIYLVSLHGLMPFLSTRAFGESVATPLVLLGFCFLYALPKKYHLGFFFLGIATLFRFQVGLIYVCALLLLLFRRDAKAFWAGIKIGILTTLLQASVDYFAGRGPMETLFNYLAVNEGGATSYGVTPWYNPILLLLALGFFPLSLPLFKNFKELFHKHSTSLIPFVFFVAIHCMIPHKEERFMYPVIGLLLVYLAFLWAENWESSGNRWIFLPSFVTINSLVLFIACFNNTQSSEIEPMAAIERSGQPSLILDYDSLLGKSWVKEYYIRAPHRLMSFSDGDFPQLKETLGEFPQFLIITSNQDNRQKIENELANNTQWDCDPLTVASSFSDRLVYAANPHRNPRRRPSWYRICRPQEML